MISLAIADKPLVRDLLATHQLDVDYLETSGPMTESAVQIASVPLLLHNAVWDWSLADPLALEQPNVMEFTQRMLSLTRAPWLSVHLGFSAAQVQFDGGMQIRSELLTRGEVLANICRNVAHLANAIPVPLLIENLDYNLGGAYEYICEPAFIAEVLHQTHVGLLLDLAHARVSASRLGCTITDYLAYLPLDQVKQLHVSGPRWHADVLQDVHETLQDEDYALLSDILTQTTPAALTLEYARDPRTMSDQLDRLRQLLDGR